MEIQIVTDIGGRKSLFSLPNAPFLWSNGQKCPLQ
jgi:hypothetical protein